MIKKKIKIVLVKRNIKLKKIFLKQSNRIIFRAKIAFARCGT